MSGAEGGGPGEGGVTLARVFDYLRGMREEQLRDGRQLEQVSSLLLRLTDQVRRMDRRLGEMDRRIGEMDRRIGELDRRLSEQKDDLELMLKSELMGQFGMLRTELGHRFDKVADRIAVLEGSDPWRAALGPRS